RQELARQGFCWAEMTTEPLTLENGTAELVVTLKSEGPLALLDAVQFTGLKLNRPEDVIAFLGLKVGMPVSLSVLRNVREKLWETGRFLKHEIQADISPAHPGRVKLTIDMLEHPDAKPIGIEQPMTPAQAA